MYESDSGEITLTFGGDAMISRALMPFREPQFYRPHQSKARLKPVLSSPPKLGRAPAPG